MEYIRKLRMILKSVLNAKDEITVIGVLAIPVLRHSFRISKCRLEETTNTTRKTTNNVKEADIDNLYVKTREEGSGLLKIEVAYREELINNVEYVNAKYKNTYL
jgi:uncharacterized protein with FMN-binding domain